MAGTAAFMVPIMIGMINAPIADAHVSRSFEVASIKPSPAGERIGSMHVQAGGQTYLIRNTSVRFMILRVYRLTWDQLAGGPAWLNTELFDVEAKAGHQGKLEDLNRMFQHLLADRFKLQFHREIKQLPVYALTVDQKGTKPKANDTADEFSGRMGPSIGIKGLPGMRGIGVSIPELCWNLSLIVGRPVLDRTDLTGYYDFNLEFTYDAGIPAEGADAPPLHEGPTIFNAIRDAGLKLESQKGPVEVMVIDSIEKPSAN